MISVKVSSVLRWLRLEASSSRCGLKIVVDDFGLLLVRCGWEMLVLGASMLVLVAILNQYDSKYIVLVNGFLVNVVHLNDSEIEF